MESFLNQHTRLVDVGVPAELGIDEGKGNIAVRAKSGEAGDAHESTLDGLGDAGFHFLRREASGFRQDDDGGFRQIRQHLDRELRGGA